jgi:hypothetical protein
VIGNSQRFDTAGKSSGSAPRERLVSEEYPKRQPSASTWRFVTDHENRSAIRAALDW